MPTEDLITATLGLMGSLITNLFCKGYFGPNYGQYVKLSADGNRMFITSKRKNGIVEVCGLL
jgi:hypothetical protein